MVPRFTALLNKHATSWRDYQEAPVNAELPYLEPLYIARQVWFKNTRFLSPVVSLVSRAFRN